MPRPDRKRLDVRLERGLYNRLAASALCDQRTINAQIAWLLAYALIDWQEQLDNRLARIKVKATA